MSTTADERAYRNYNLAGSILLVLAIFGSLATLGCAFIFPVPAMLVGIFSLILGKCAFDSLETAVQFEPSPALPGETFLHRLDLFSALLKTGQEVHVVLQVQYEKALDERATLARIQAELQRTFNSYLLGVDKLSADPFTEIDFIINTSVAPLAKRLGLIGLELKTIDVKLGSNQGKADQWPK